MLSSQSLTEARVRSANVRSVHLCIEQRRGDVHALVDGVVVFFILKLCCIPPTHQSDGASNSPDS